MGGHRHERSDRAGGRIVAAGAPSDIVDENLVREVFGIDAVVIPDPASGTPLVSPLGRHHQSTSFSRSFEGANDGSGDRAPCINAIRAHKREETAFLCVDRVYA
ncbi:hypothetical protein [Microbacterium trichothecenolyticum]|uniref:Uncharacterized protein n=1 Tax=Microbacterium trichothecenolyticum TaxID=69370 RepID=A0ABU0TX93_MICTR|nr:hypothetical protein [Microbacterium trichothecenolyticum]MDQ1124285.1 hypothetical protein [Microbacterium trichothecenolyticum]